MWIALGDREIERVAKAGKLEGKPVTYAYNSIALMVAKDNPCKIEAVSDLAKAEVKTIAVPDEQNSSGYYAKQAFEKAGVWPKLQSKLWLTDQPAMVKGQLASGKAEVAVVYYPCTRETRVVGGKPEEMRGKVQLLGKVPTDLSGPIPAQAAAIRGCTNPAAGRAFLAFLLEDQVQDIWEKWAFDRATQPASGPRVSLYLYCGAGIRPMMDRAIEAFKQKMPNVRIDVGYAGSGCLLSQLAFAKRGDLYMPGEDFYLNQAKGRGLITTSKLVGYFEPVLLVQKGNPKGILTIEDLARQGVEVALGEPEAAAIGRATNLILERARLKDKVEPNVRVRHGNVPELGNAVKLKTVDVAVVWNVTAAQVADDCDAVKLSPGSYEPSPVPLGLLKYSTHAPEARAFIDYLAGPAGQQLVQECGMLPAARTR